MRLMRGESKRNQRRAISQPERSEGMLCGRIEGHTTLKPSYSTYRDSGDGRDAWLGVEF